MQADCHMMGVIGVRPEVSFQAAASEDAIHGAQAHPVGECRVHPGYHHWRCLMDTGGSPVFTAGWHEFSLPLYSLPGCLSDSPGMAAQLGCHLIGMP